MFLVSVGNQNNTYRSRYPFVMASTRQFIGDGAPSSFSVRSATVERITNETKIQCSLALDVHPSLAPQSITVKTGLGFLDHVSRLRRMKTRKVFSDGVISTVAHHRCCTLWPSTEVCR